MRPATGASTAPSVSCCCTTDRSAIRALSALPATLNAVRASSSPSLERRVRKAVARWQPYAGMVYFHLLLDGLEAVHKAGYLQPIHMVLASLSQFRALIDRKNRKHAAGR